MCGIFGIAVPHGQIAPGLLERAADSLSHRGPDDSGTCIISDTAFDCDIGLSHRRLSILDLTSGGHQPMHDPATGNWIVYNGEIYNFRELRHDLIAEGVTFSTNSDTEVLLKAYGAWGEESVARLRGMFAFALWDALRHQLFLARDPFGIKPLYYSRAGNRLLFSSQLRTLLATGLVARRIDPAGLANYLAFGSTYDPNTLVSGVSMLPPGHCITWHNAELRERAYWTPASSSTPETNQQLVDSEERLHEVLDESIRMQTISDVPSGVFLSGGIDSSAIAAVLHRSGADLRTFSMVFAEHDFNEAAHSRAVAQKFSAEHHEVHISESDALAAVPDSIDAMDQPSIDGVNTYLISRAARAAGMKVALSGLGSDELFAGYSTFRTVPRMEKFSEFAHHFPHTLRRAAASSLGALAVENDRTRKYATLVGSNGALVHPYFLARMLFTPSQRHALCRGEDQNVSERASLPLVAGIRTARHLDPINRVSLLESRYYMANTLLRDADCMSMAHGLEVRVPFLDQKLVRRAFAIPGHRKIHRELPKPVLVRPLRHLLPPEIVHRPKRGFTLPWEDWLRNGLRHEMSQTLARIGNGPLAPLLNSTAISKIWDDFMHGRTSWSRPWSLYVLQRWAEQHSVAS